MRKVRYSILAIVIPLAFISASAQTHHPAYELMVRAAERETTAQGELHSRKMLLGFFDATVDPNRSGVIGVDYSSITTTIGYLKAKRAAANPDFSAYIVRMLVDHGIGQDDSVLVCMTGSFPGMNLAVLTALEVLDILSLRICSIGSSSYGANQEEFTWIDMEHQLSRTNLLEQRSNFVTLGGTGDIGGGLSHEARDLIRERAFQLNYPLLKARSLRKQTAMRREVIGNIGKYQLLINIGGNHAMLGRGPEGRALPGGWNDPATFDWSSVDEENLNGIVFDFLRDGIPVLNLLHIEDIARDAELPFDPETFGPPGESPVYFLNYTKNENR